MEIIISNELIFLPAANELPKGYGNRIPSTSGPLFRFLVQSYLVRDPVALLSPSVVDPYLKQIISSSTRNQVCYFGIQKLYPLDVDKRVLKGLSHSTWSRFS